MRRHVEAAGGSFPAQVQLSVDNVSRKGSTPLVVADGAKASGDWTIVTRDDGQKQWAYKGKPLYGFAKDTKAGDKTGDGFLNGAWHVAK